MGRSVLSAILLGIALMLPTNAPADAGEQLASVAAALEQLGRSGDAARVRSTVAASDPEVLETIYGDTDLSGISQQLVENANLQAQLLSEIRAASAAISAAGARAAPSGLEPEGASSGVNGTFPDAPWPAGNDTAVDRLCPLFKTNPGTKSSAKDGLETMRTLARASKALEQAQIVYNLFKGIWNGASRACDQTVVVAGFGNNFSTFCIPVDVILAVAKFLVAQSQYIIWVAQTNADVVKACNGAVQTAEISGSYQRLGHVEQDLRRFEDDVDAKVSELHDMSELLNQVLLEEDLRRGAVSRLSVNYLQRLGETCDTAEDALALVDKNCSLGQLYLDGGRQLAATGTDPKRAFDLCKKAYQVAVGSCQ